MNQNDYPIRTSELERLQVISVSESSIIQVGDRSEVYARMRTIAVQREQDHTVGGEAQFNSYPIFYRPWPVHSQLYEPLPVQVTTRNLAPCIQVCSVDILATSSAALILIGNGRVSRAESRIKHIRQFAAPSVSAVLNSPQAPTEDQ